MKIPCVIDNDCDEITAVIDSEEIRGWSYHNEDERRVKMLAAREFCEGWFQAAKKSCAAEMITALRLHKAWADSERAGPDYGGQTRDTHPDGERIWRRWWDGQLDLCDRAGRATDAAIAKAEGDGS